MFAYGSKAQIKNLKIQNVNFISNSLSSVVGIFFANCSYCTFSNVTVNSTSKNTLRGGIVGGFCGSMNSVTASNCKITKTSISALGKKKKKKKKENLF